MVETVTGKRHGAHPSVVLATNAISGTATTSSDPQTTITSAPSDDQTCVEPAKPHNNTGKYAQCLTGIRQKVSKNQN